MKKASVFIVLSLLLVLLFFSSVALGTLKFSFAQIWDALLGRGDQLVIDVLFELRLPRVLVALVIGMNLASAGALMQAVMQNPLADPGIIGISAGASVGGVVLMLALPQYAYLVPPVAFVGAMFAAFFDICFSVERWVYSCAYYSIRGRNQCTLGQPYRAYLYLI